MKVLKLVAISIAGFVGLVVVFAVGARFLGSPRSGSQEAEPAPIGVVASLTPEGQLQEIHNKVSADAVAQYEMVKESGSKMERCVQAQTVAASFLQAKDQENYKKWQEVKKADCKSAGLPDL